MDEWGKMEMIATHGTAGTQEVTVQDASAERRLWLAVLALAVEDWTRGSLKTKRTAQRFLFEDGSDFRTVCASAGLDADSLRSKLLKIGRRVEMEGALRYPAAA